MSKAEIILIMIHFHDSSYCCLKHFYLEKVCKHMRHLFPWVNPYNRFVELEKVVAILLALFIRKVLWVNAQASVLLTALPYGYVKPENPYSQDVQRNSAKRQIFQGLILRIQVASDMQRAWRTIELHDYSR